jgi:1,4-alpha-glucan branching enzyme
LPYIRHPEHEYFLEENWLYEAITETYPLISLLSCLVDDNIDFRITLLLSPSVIEMLKDDFLMERYKRHIGNLIEISEREIYRTKGDISLGPVVRMYRERFLNIRYIFEDVHKRNLVSAFQKLQDTGNVEIITSAATHAFLPNLSSIHRQSEHR